MYKEDGVKSIAYDVNTLKIIGMLWCDGDDKEKVVELYDLLQDNN